MATTATPWTGANEYKLYLQSGQFTSTLKTSEYIGATDTSPQGVSWDGVDTPWIGLNDNKLYLQSGQFTSTLKTSQYIGDIDLLPLGVTWDGVNTPWVGAAKLYLQSGQFTSTLKTSFYVGGLETAVRDISYDGADTPWTGTFDDKLYLQSGQFTSTLKTSEDINGVDDEPTGISWDGVNTPWCGNGDKLYLQSGQFTSTLKTSRDVSGIDPYVSGVCTDDYDARVGGAPAEYFPEASDAITINDTAGFDAEYVVTASDAITINDTAGFDAVVVVTASDAVAITDVASCFRVREVAASDVIAISDIASYNGVFTVTGASNGLVFVDEATAYIALNLTYYGTLEEANEYFEKRLHEWAWSDASIRNKERALFEARCLMDGLCYKGDKHTVYVVMQQWAEGTVIDDDKLVEIRTAEAAQRNEFPRGVDVDVPEDILIAQYEIAHSLLDNKDPELELEILAITSSTYGGVKTVYQREQLPLEHLIHMIPNAVAWRQIRPYLRDGDAIKLSRVS